jgi:hypothetical protein
MIVDCEVKTRLSEPVSGRRDDKGTIRPTLCPHDDNCIAVRKRKHDLHAGGGPSSKAADRIESRVKHVAGAPQAPEPGRVTERTCCRVDKLKDLVCEAFAGIETPTEER